MDFISHEKPLTPAQERALMLLTLQSPPLLLSPQELSCPIMPSLRPPRRFIRVHHLKIAMIMAIALMAGFVGAELRPKAPNVKYVTVTAPAVPCPLLPAASPIETAPACTPIAPMTCGISAAPITTVQVAKKKRKKGRAKHNPATLAAFSER